MPCYTPFVTVCTILNKNTMFNLKGVKKVWNSAISAWFQLSW